MKELKCKNCGAPILSENIVARLNMARCSHCNSVFTLDDKKSENERKWRHQIPMPDKFDISNRSGVFEINWRWFSPMHVFLLFFAIFWNGFMIVWFGIALSSGIYIMAAAGSLHTMVGLGLIYYTVAGFINRSYVRIETSELSVFHKPLPWFGAKKLRSDELVQLYCKEKITNGKNGTSYSYEVYGRTYSGGAVKIIKGLSDAEHALYIEQELERYLGIRDEKVAGEFKG